MLLFVIDLKKAFSCLYLSGANELLKKTIFSLRNKQMTWVSTGENLSSGWANNKGADQPAYQHSLISAFVIRLLECIPKLHKGQTTHVCSVWLYDNICLECIQINTMGWGFEPRWRHCNVYPLLSTGSTQEDPSGHN